MKRSAKRRVFTTRLKAFNSFSDTFSTSTTKSGWKTLSGTWTSGSNAFSSSSGSALAIVPLSKSNATVSTIIPSGGGTGVAFWALDSSNYWAAYGYSTSSTSSTCSSAACSGTENYTVTQSCSCPFAGYYYPSTCGNGACSGSENFTNYRSCSCNTSYGTCAQNQGTCVSSPNYTTCYYPQTTCVYTAGSSSTISLGCYSAFSGCSQYSYPYGETSAPGICGCPTGANKVCCTQVVTTSGSWNNGACSYSGQTVTSSTLSPSGCNYPGQSIATGTYSFNYGSCSYAGQQVNIGWNYGSCSYAGQVVATGTSYTCISQACSGVEAFTDSRSCSCPQTALYSSTCNNGACSGTYSYQASRSCSCTTNYARKVRVVKYISGSPTTVGEFTVSSMPTTISVLTNGTSVTVTGSGSSNTYTNSDGTTYKNFGILKTDGGAEQSTAISSFTALVS